MFFCSCRFNFFSFIFFFGFSCISFLLFSLVLIFHCAMFFFFLSFVCSLFYFSSVCVCLVVFQLAWDVFFLLLFCFSPLFSVSIFPFSSDISLSLSFPFPFYLLRSYFYFPVPILVSHLSLLFTFVGRGHPVYCLGKFVPISLYVCLASPPSPNTNRTNPQSPLRSDDVTKKGE